MLCATSEHTSTKVGFDLSIIEAALSNIFSCYSSFSTLGAAKILTRKNGATSTFSWKNCMSSVYRYASARFVCRPQQYSAWVCLRFDVKSRTFRASFGDYLSITGLKSEVKETKELIGLDARLTTQHTSTFDWFKVDRSGGPPLCRIHYLVYGSW